MSYPTARLKWTPAWRVIPSRFPSVGLFERVARPEDFDALYALEAMTNDRIRDEVDPVVLKRDIILRHQRFSIVPYGLFIDDIAVGTMVARPIHSPAITLTLYLSLGRTMHRQVVKSLKPFAFDRLYGAFPEQVVKADAKAAVERSADRYLKRIGG